MNVDPWIGTRYTSSKKNANLKLILIYINLFGMNVDPWLGTHFTSKKENLTLKLTCVFMRIKGV